MNAAGCRSRSQNGRRGAHNHDPNASATALSRHGIADAFRDGGCSEVRLPSRDTGSPASAAVRSLTVSGSPRSPHPNREPHIIAQQA